MKKIIAFILFALSFFFYSDGNAQTLVSDRGIFRDSIQLNGVWITAERLEQCPVEPFDLPIATPDSLGGIRIGPDFSIDGSGVLSLSGGGGSGTDSSLHVKDGLTKKVIGKDITIGVDSSRLPTLHHLETTYPKITDFNTITSDTIIQLSGSGKVLGQLNIHMNSNLLITDKPTDSVALYDHWAVHTNGTKRHEVTMGDFLDFVDGAGVDITYDNLGNKITIAAPNIPPAENSTGKFYGTPPYPASGPPGFRILQSVDLPSLPISKLIQDSPSTYIQPGYLGSGATNSDVFLNGDGEWVEPPGGQSSDARLKDTVAYERHILPHLNTVSYTWKDGRDTATHVGYVAQEILPLLPSAVSKDSKGYYRVDYSEVHTAAIVELYRLIKAQQTEMDQLRNEINDLK